jgi:hypothetical protein
MRQLQFDAFGEPVTQDLHAAAEPANCTGAASRIALKAGIGVFWMLVVVIVAARAAFFDPNFAEHLSSAVALGQYVQQLIAT